MSALPLSAFVQSMRHEADSVISVELRPAANATAFPPFTPGAHIDLHLPGGLVRCYSLLNPATDTQRYVIGVLNDRNSRGGSRYVHQQLRVGMTIPISAPRNNFQLSASAPHSVLVAGGIGVTPMLCMLRSLAARGQTADFIYCARSRKEAAFVAEIMALASPAVRVACHFDDEKKAAPDLGRLLAGHNAATHFYCCGPAPMLDAFERTCQQLGYAHAHIERFAAPATDATGAAGGAYQVELRRTGTTLEVAPGKSLLDTLIDAGLSPDYSCKEGVCGSCETKVLAGEVDHRDSILSKAERAANKSMMICVSGCKRGPLVLDL